MMLTGMKPAAAMIKIFSLNASSSTGAITKVQLTAIGDNYKNISTEWHIVPARF